MHIYIDQTVYNTTTLPMHSNICDLNVELFLTSSVAVAMSNAVFGKGSGNTYQLARHCVGMNCSIVLAPHNQCDHLDDLSVFCQPGELRVNREVKRLSIISPPTTYLHLLHSSPLFLVSNRHQARVVRFNSHVTNNKS